MLRVEDFSERFQTVVNPSNWNNKMIEDGRELDIPHVPYDKQSVTYGAKILVNWLASQTELGQPVHTFEDGEYFDADRLSPGSIVFIKQRRLTKHFSFPKDYFEPRHPAPEIGLNLGEAEGRPLVSGQNNVLYEESLAISTPAESRRIGRVLIGVQANHILRDAEGRVKLQERPRGIQTSFTVGKTQHMQLTHDDGFAETLWQPTEVRLQHVNKEYSSKLSIGDRFWNHVESKSVAEMFSRRLAEL